MILNILGLLGAIGNGASQGINNFQVGQQNRIKLAGQRQAAQTAKQTAAISNGGNPANGASAGVLANIPGFNPNAPLISGSGSLGSIGQGQGQVAGQASQQSGQAAPQPIGELDIQSIADNANQQKALIRSQGEALLKLPGQDLAKVQSITQSRLAQVDAARNEQLAPLSRAVSVISEKFATKNPEDAQRLGQLLIEQNPQLGQFFDPNSPDFENQVLSTQSFLGIDETLRNSRLETFNEDNDAANTSRQSTQDFQESTALQDQRTQDNREEEILDQSGADRTSASNERVAELNNTGEITSKTLEEQGKQDVRDLAAARQKVSDTIPTIQALDQARGVIERANFDTGSLATLRGEFIKLGATFGVDGLTDSASDFEIINKVGKQLGIQTLQLVGGNDTERELITAIQTNIGADKLPKTNRRLLSEKSAAIKTIIQRPQFLEGWLRDHRSTLGTNDQGQNFSEAWREEQQTIFEVQKALDAIERGAPRDAVIELLQRQDIDPARLEDGRL